MLQSLKEPADQEFIDSMLNFYFVLDLNLQTMATMLHAMSFCLQSLLFE